MTTTQITCLIDEKGIEILVAWHRERGIILDSVEVVIAGRGIDITNSLDDNQYFILCEEINSSI